VFYNRIRVDYRSFIRIPIPKVKTMLILKAFVNENQIDEIWVQNVETVALGLCKYKIRKPEGDFPLISHYRQDGWRVLTEKVLKILEEKMK
jgi:hypothetical protein